MSVAAVCANDTLAYAFNKATLSTEKEQEEEQDKELNMDKLSSKVTAPHPEHWEIQALNER
jgi:hypothetical protein